VRLDDARAEFRTRTSFEAVDFGAHVLRAHALSVARGILVYSLAPTLAAVLALMLAGEPWLAILLVFWLRPIDARIALLVTSRGLFGDLPSLRETGRLLVTEGRRRLLWDLTLGRLSFVRSLTLPVALLEGVVRERRAQRFALVTRGLGGVAAALAFGTLGLELVLAGACTSVLEQAGELRHLVGPGSFESDLFAETSGAEETTTVARFALFYALAAPLGEALHAVSGFALYLNRRTLAEGWDIELAFRRLASRVGVAASLLLGLVAAPVALAESDATSVPALLAEEEARQARYDRARDELEAVLARPEFGREIVEETYEPRFRPDPQKQSAAAPDFSWLGIIGEIFAWVAVTLLAIGAAFLLVRALPFLSRPEALPGRPNRAGGASDREGALPRGVPLGGLVARARHLARQGRALEALALLYAGAIEALAARFPIELPSDATEGECLRAVRRRAPEAEARRFAAVTRAWQLAAYRGELPSAAELDQLVALAAPLFEEAA
jgi:hypothetical protein